MLKTLRYVLNVQDFDATVRFWTAGMGLPLIGGWDRGADDCGALVEVTPGAVIEVVGHGPAGIAVDYREQAIAIELGEMQEVDAVRERLVGLGIAVSSPMVQPWGHYSATVRDPNHLEVVLYCQLPT